MFPSGFGIIAGCLFRCLCLGAQQPARSPDWGGGILATIKTLLYWDAQHVNIALSVMPIKA